MADNAQNTATPRNEACKIIDQDSPKGFFMKHQGEVVETTRSYEGQNTRGLLFANKFFAAYGPSVKPTMTAREFIKHPDAQILTIHDEENNRDFYRASIGGSDYYTSKNDVTNLFV